MVAAAERNGKHLMIGHNMRFDPVHRKAKELLDGGIIGDIITFRATMGNAGPENWSMEAGSTWFFDKQKAAMDQADVPYPFLSLYDLTYPCVRKLLDGFH